MVTYGPWRQDPDYDGSPAVTVSRTGVAAETETPYQSPRRAISNTDLELAFNAARAAVLSGVHDPKGLNLWGAAISWGYELSFPDTKSTWTAEVNRHLINIAPGTHWYNPPNYGYTDPTAIGIDYENRPYDPENPWADDLGEQLAVHLLPTTRFGGFWDDTSQPPDYTLAPTPPPSDLILASGAGQTAIAVIPAPVNPVPDLGNPIYQELDTTIDLTPYVEPNGWSGSLWLETAFHGPKANPEDDGSQGLVRYGWGFDRLRIVATVRPPRYRWVYPGDEAVPYRRIYPRDDMLGAGSARNYPPSKARQSGNRTAGGYL